LGSQLQKFPSISFHGCFRTEVRQSIRTVRACVEGGCLPHGSQEEESVREREKERERGENTQIPSGTCLKDIAQ
jgi:hypothetical protein